MQKGFLQRVYQLEQQTTLSERPLVLQGSRELREILWQQYEETEHFRQIMDELWSHKVASQIYSLATFQADVLAQTKKELTKSYQWRD